MTPKRFALCLSAALAFAPHAARAEPYYPGDIVTDLDLMCPSPNFPDCTICHLSDSGGALTVHKPFGAALMSMFGLVGNSAGSLANALREASAAGLDANGDGVPDIEALKNCMDPNVYAPLMIGDSGAVEAIPPVRAQGPPIPTYGCAVARAPGKAGGGGEGAALLGVTWAAVILVRRARRLA